MRAWRVVQLGEPEDALQLADLAVGAPGPAQVVVEVEAASVNFPDLLLCRGQYQEKPPLPFTPGLEAAGRVVEAGPEAGIALGTPVIVLPKAPNGAYQELIVCDAADVLPLPAGLSSRDAAALYITYVTGHLALHRRAGLRAGETLLVHGGAGGVGTAAIQLGVAAGAHVIATANGARKAQFCKEFGADVAIDLAEEDFVEVVNRVTDKRGADVIFDPVGGEIFDRSRKCIAFEGRLLVIGFAGGVIPSAPANHLLVKNYAAVGVHMGLYRRRNPSVLAESLREVMRLYAAGAVKPYVSALFAFADVPAALRLVADRAVLGKVVVDVR